MHKHCTGKCRAWRLDLRKKVILDEAICNCRCIDGSLSVHLVLLKNLEFARTDSVLLASKSRRIAFDCKLLAAHRDHLVKPQYHNSQRATTPRSHARWPFAPCAKAQTHRIQTSPPCIESRKGSHSPTQICPRPSSLLLFLVFPGAKSSDRRRCLRSCDTTGNTRPTSYDPAQALYETPPSSFRRRENAYQ